MPRRPANFRPSCTHPIMDLHYGQDHCDVCGQLPSLGFLYRCSHDKNSKPQSSGALSVATNGVYTAEQQSTVEQQKRHVEDVIRRASPAPRCSFKCCHTCRPYMRDRAFLNFEAAYLGEVDGLTNSDWITLPMADVRVFQPPQTGNEPLPSESSTSTSTSISISIASSSTGERAGAPLPTSDGPTPSNQDSVISTVSSSQSALRRLKKNARRFYSLRTAAMSDSDLSEEESTPYRKRDSIKKVLARLRRRQGNERSGRESSSEGSAITIPGVVDATHTNR